MERLQKILAQAGVASRRKAEEMIVSGRVSVDGEVIRELGFKTDFNAHMIAVDGKLIVQKENAVYFMLNKPKGYICTLQDEHGRKTVRELLPNITERIYPLGRLDGNTEGLLLLTNDGRLMQSLLHPKFEVKKTYVAVVDGGVTHREVMMLKNGIELSDGITAPAMVRIISEDVLRERTKLEITIHEGRNRQIRRMCQAIGHNVRSLKRTEFAGLSLSGLKRGMYRRLTSDEIKYLYELSGAREDRI